MFKNYANVFKITVFGSKLWRFKFDHLFAHWFALWLNPPQRPSGGGIAWFSWRPDGIIHHIFLNTRKYVVFDRKFQVFPGFHIFVHLFRCRDPKLDRYDGPKWARCMIYHDLLLKTTVFSLKSTAFLQFSGGYIIH